MIRISQCKNGHYYDSESSSSCPYCCAKAKIITASSTSKTSKMGVGSYIIPFLFIIAFPIIIFVGVAKYSREAKDVSVIDCYDEVADTEDVMETVEELTPEGNLLNDYIINDMCINVGTINTNNIYLAPYVRLEDENRQWDSYGFVGGLDGILKYVIYDLDKDDIDEALVFRLKDNKADYGQHYSNLWCQIYEVIDNKVQMVTEYNADCNIGGADTLEHHFYLKDMGWVVYIAHDCTIEYSSLSEGTIESISVYHYDNEGLHSDVQISIYGTDLTIYNEEVMETSGKLDSLGFNQTAGSLGYDLEIKVEDNLQHLLTVEGYNSAMKLDAYYRSNDMHDLGAVTITFKP